MKRVSQALVAIAAFGVAGIASAHGHGRFFVGFGFPVAAPVYVAPPPVYYVQPPVVYMAPPPVYLRPAYVYYPQPVTVYRSVPPVVEIRSDRREVAPEPVQPKVRAPELAPRVPRG
jgi:hypothetical protein